jgi:hypothetical protein
MAKSKQPSEDQKREEREEREREEHPQYQRGRGNDRDDERHHPRRRRMGREHAVHQQIIDRRLGGGAPATPEAYVKALEEWHQLPGSVIRPPTDVKPDTTENGTDKDDEGNTP